MLARQDLWWCHACKFYFKPLHVYILDEVDNILKRPSNYEECKYILSYFTEQCMRMSQHIWYNFGFCFAGSFAGLGFLSLYLSGKVKVFDRKGHVAKLCIVLLPLLIASLVGVSRVNDYWHHWQDVFAGGVLGMFLLLMKKM